MSKTMGRLLIVGLPVAIIAGFIFLFIVMATLAPKPEKADARPRPVAVFVAEAEREPVALTVSSQGEARPLTEISLVPQVAGRIAYVNPNFVQGGFFEANEVLVRIEDADYRLAVTRAEASVAQARQALIREEAESELARQEWESLGEGEASTLTLREPQLAEARAQLAAAEASLQEARLNLSRTRIFAPFAGRVRSKSADLGQYVGPGAELGQIFSSDTIEIRLPLTDNQLALLGIPVAFMESEARPGPSVTLSAILAGQERHWQARLVRTDSSIDPQTRVLYAIAQLNDPYGAGADNGTPLPVGMFVNAQIEGRTLDNSIRLPRSALRGENNVYVAEQGGRLSIRTVAVVTSNHEYVILTSGVSDGDMVITSPVRSATNGMPIQSIGADGQPIEALSADLTQTAENTPPAEGDSSVAHAD
ncbi:efflux RND transporter periplasmic adaptor subunit [Woodsholea maritima]|uniref:efflux RND transporter periplasmic adaptor subunit n=1 Tax=Woodsholea maritima TaxID=240237 RepID=UPI00036BF26F|nr:efflux RND transporter periplasmic adaptor subunit [Woodsholea maritima]